MHARRKTDDAYSLPSIEEIARVLGGAVSSA